MPTTITPVDRRLAVRGLTFHVVEWGAPAAHALVFLHGITAHARTWDDEARALAGRFHVLAIDQRGHGDSDPAPDGDYGLPTLVDDLAALLDALGVGRARVVGLSLGGRVAFAYAAAHPERVDRLVVVDIGPDIAPAGLARVLGAMATAPERFADVEEAVRFLRAMNPRYTERLLRHRVEHGLKRTADGALVWKYDAAMRAAARDGRGRPALDLWPVWKAVACPTLLVQGGESDILSDEIALHMVEAQPLARRVVVPDAGHTVPGDQPALFLALLDDFLNPAV